MRKVTFLICLFILFPVTLSAQPPKPRRATGAGVISTPYLKWVSFTREFGIKGDLLGLDNSLRFSPDGRTIFIAGANGPVLLPTPYPNTQINLRTTKSVKEVLQKGKITNYYLSPDLQRIFISKPNGGSEVWNPHNAKRIGDIERIFLLSFSPDGQMLSTIDYGSERVEVWNSHNARISTTISISALSATPFSSSHTTFSPDRKMLAVVGRRNVNSKLQEFIIDILNPHNGKRIRTITVPKRGLKVKMNTPIVFSPDGQALVVGIELMKQAYKFRTFEEQHEQKTKYTQDSLEFLNPHNGRHIRSVELPKEYSGAQSLVFSPDGQILAGAMTEKLGAMTNTIFLWDPHTGEHLRTLQTENLVKSVVFSPNGQILAPSSGKDTIPLWNPHTGEVTRTLKHYVTFEDFKTLPGVEFPAAAKGEVSGLDIIDFTFNPDGRIAAAIAGYFPVFWEISTGLGADNTGVERETEFHQQLKNPESDGGGRWVNLEGMTLEDDLDGDLDDDLDQVKTRYTGNETEIIFVNLTKAAIAYHWIDGNGEEKYYGSIPAGGFVNQPTYVGHVWLVKDVPPGYDYDHLLFEAVEEPGRALVH